MMAGSGERKVFSTLGASNHTEEERAEQDFYATDPKALELLLERERFSNVWECACGENHLADVLERKGLLKRKSDIVDRCEEGGIEILDFLSAGNKESYNGDIITNPPYKHALEFVEKALSLVEEKRKVAMFLRIQFLEGAKAAETFRQGAAENDLRAVKTVELRQERRLRELRQRRGLLRLVRLAERVRRQDCRRMD